MDMILHAHLRGSRTSSQAAGTDDLTGGSVLITGSNHSLAVAQWEQFEPATENSGGGSEDGNTGQVDQSSHSCLGQHFTACEMHSVDAVKHNSVNSHSRI